MVNSLSLLDFIELEIKFQMSCKQYMHAKEYSQQSNFHDNRFLSVLSFNYSSANTLSVKKIPVVLRPVIKLPVKSMASIGPRRKAEI